MLTEAYAEAIKAVAVMVTEIVRGQPPEVKKQLWDWYVQDQARWRKLFGID